jgi:hypothetical protein
LRDAARAREQRAEERGDGRERVVAPRLVAVVLVGEDQRAEGDEAGREAELPDAEAQFEGEVADVGL